MSSRHGTHLSQNTHRHNYHVRFFMACTPILKTKGQVRRRPRGEELQLRHQRARARGRVARGPGPGQGHGAGGGGGRRRIAERGDVQLGDRGLQEGRPGGGGVGRAEHAQAEGPAAGRDQLQQRHGRLRQVCVGAQVAWFDSALFGHLRTARCRGRLYRA